MAGGRPRSVSLPPDEMIKLGEEMVSWVRENDPVHLSEWYTIKMGYTESEWDTMYRAPEFFTYYEKALKMIGIKYLTKDNNIESSIKHRWLRHYFGDLRKREDSDVDNEYARKLKLIQDEAKLKSELGNLSTEEMKEQMNALLTLISSTQSSRKIDATNSKTDIKS